MLLDLALVLVDHGVGGVNLGLRGGLLLFAALGGVFDGLLVGLDGVFVLFYGVLGEGRGAHGGEDDARKDKTKVFHILYVFGFSDYKNKQFRPYHQEFF